MYLIRMFKNENVVSFNIYYYKYVFKDVRLPLEPFNWSS